MTGQTISSTLDGMNLSERRHALLHRAALLCAALVLAITSLSAFMRLSGVGLGCEPWPQCYGERLREAQQGRPTTVEDSHAVAAARLAHRVVAVLALLLVLTMVAVCFGNRPWLGRAGAWAVALLLLSLGLAVLGRYTAGARVPAVTIGNLLGGMLMLAICWRLATREAAQPNPTARVWARASAVLLLVQLTLGALVSASYAGPSCTGLGDCWRTAQAAGWPWHLLDPWREPVFDASAAHPINPGGALVQLLHRFTALALLATLLPLAWQVINSPRRRVGIALLIVLALVIAIGLLMATGAVPLPLALAHNMAAALLLALVLSLA